MENLQPPAPTEDVGIIVGRFQVPELHVGHRQLIETIGSNHQKVVIFLGSRPGILGSRKNPMDFQTREQMIKGSYPNTTVLPMNDQPSDKAWSEELDRRIAEVTQSRSVRLYGSRDGFCASYSGKHETTELAATRQLSGTEVRAAVSNTINADRLFRQGVVYAAFNRYPVSYQTVDAAVIRATNHRQEPGTQVLLGRKSTDPIGQYRLPGGFVDPSDTSLEHTGARELREETNAEVVMPPKYAGSHRQDDWRYRGEKDSILTSLFVYTFLCGGVRAGDDLEAVQWFTVNALKDKDIVESHRPLMKLLRRHLNKNKS